jgi:hypothetical protein
MGNDTTEFWVPFRLLEFAVPESAAARWAAISL